MKILIFGGAGMAGHMIKRYFEQNSSYEVWSTVQSPCTEKNCISLNIMEESKVVQLIETLRPDVVINAVGLLNDDAARKKMKSIYVNSFFPHQLQLFTNVFGYRLIHISTDCVFSGKRGNYTETDMPDGNSVYAMTKRLGEVESPACLTIRTSIIGPELKSSGIGLFHWFMRQTGEIYGYTQCFWSGVTTLELAKAIEWALMHELEGLVHLTSTKKISKFALLTLFKETFGKKDIIIKENDQLKTDKSLVSTREDFQYQVPDYPEMLSQLKEWIVLYRNSIYNHYIFA